MCRIQLRVVPWISKFRDVPSSFPLRSSFFFFIYIYHDKLTKILSSINEYGTVYKRSASDASPHTHTDTGLPIAPRDTCVDPFLSPLASRDIVSYAHTHGGHARRQAVVTSPTKGYVTTDAFGTDGDDTAHEALADYDYPNFFQALGGFPSGNGSLPDVVDLIFTDYIQPSILEYLATVQKADGTTYGEDDVTYYIDETFSTQMYLPLYVQTAEEFQKNAENCTIY